MITRKDIKNLKVGDKITVDVHWRAPMKNNPTVMRKKYFTIKDAVVKEIGTETFKWAGFLGDKENGLKKETFYYKESFIKKAKDHFSFIYEDDTYICLKVQVEGFEGLREVYIGDKGDYPSEEN